MARSLKKIEPVPALLFAAKSNPRQVELKSFKFNVALVFCSREFPNTLKLLQS